MSPMPCKRTWSTTPSRRFGHRVCSRHRDLLGVTPLNYDDGRSDGRLVAALGPAATKVRSVLRHLGARSRPRPTTPPNGLVDRTDYFIALWNGPELLRAREVVRAGVPMHALEDEDGVVTNALKMLFTFLESFADALLAGEIEEHRARPIFEAPARAVWQHARAYFAPLNSDGEWWSPLPKLAELDLRWKALP
jgi:hypothetical protein